MDFFQDFLRDNEYQMIINHHGLYIKNYQKLITLEESSITILSYHKKISIYGEKLSLKKILDHELFIEGTIHRIEVLDV